MWSRPTPECLTLGRRQLAPQTTFRTQRRNRQAATSISQAMELQEGHCLVIPSMLIRNTTLAATVSLGLAAAAHSLIQTLLWGSRPGRQTRPSPTAHNRAISTRSSANRQV